MRRNKKKNDKNVNEKQRILFTEPLDHVINIGKSHYILKGYKVIMLLEFIDKFTLLN